MVSHNSGDVSDLELEREHASVKMVLFPLITRRGNEYGEEYEAETTVYKMQVLVNRPQLRSESRSSVRSTASSIGWREEQQQRKETVGRLTPITDHSPRTTPEVSRILSPAPLAQIPERHVENDGWQQDYDEEHARTPTNQWMDLQH